ncbi:MAG: bifunctional diaminohydroxyphosphoribosylaminopyrimidine deaminase/5-amino-6-(5-phosphoribosylamino)uracil reductase RibD [Hyphomicrobiales bacterium]
MELAWRLGRRALGNTAENPPVGCVIVKDARIVGLGWTRAGGRPHAETEALRMAGREALGATAYVTLEPCVHHGRTGPCVEALVSAGIRRVVTGAQDPDPRVKGRGHAGLRAAGIETVTGLVPRPPELAGFFSRIEKKRPHVTLKLAVSEDGKIAKRGERTPITAEAARARVHMMRAQSDAVLVGLGTVKIDDPTLRCELPCLGQRSPVRVVLDSHLRIPPQAALVRTANGTPTWILSTSRGEIGEKVDVIACAADPDGKVVLADALERLAARGINRLMVEGGAEVARSFHEGGFLDEIALFQAPMTIGADGVDAVAGISIAELTRGLTLLARDTLGSDALSLYGRP